MGEIDIGTVEYVSMKNLKGKSEIKQMKIKYSIYFDLDSNYSVCFISRLLRISKRMALKYVNTNGTLSERGVQTANVG
jgi:hypothetical protein